MGKLPKLANRLVAEWRGGGGVYTRLIIDGAIANSERHFSYTPSTLYISSLARSMNNSSTWEKVHAELIFNFYFFFYFSINNNKKKNTSKVSNYFQIKSRVEGLFLSFFIFFIIIFFVTHHSRLACESALPARANDHVTSFVYRERPKTNC